MAIFNMRKNLETIFLAVVLAAVAMPKYAVAQNCNCAANLCCSQYGYCGTGDPYCGKGCQAGPCYGTPTTPSGGGGEVPKVVTQDFFNSIINQAAASCPGKRFYTRDAFLNARNSYNQFGNLGTAADSRREMAAFFAHVTHETDHFCHIEEIDGASHNYCKQSPQYPCNPNKKYFGRGPLQLTWNYNYIDAGRAINFDGLNAPETVGNNVIVSFKSALWFWMKNVRPVINQGFGATIRAINSIECNGGNPPAVDARVRYYTDYCNRFGVSPGGNLRC